MIRLPPSTRGWQSPGLRLQNMQIIGQTIWTIEIARLFIRLHNFVPKTSTFNILGRVHTRWENLRSSVISEPCFIFDYLRVSSCFSSCCTWRIVVLRCSSLFRSDALESPLRAWRNKATYCCVKSVQSFLAVVCRLRLKFELGQFRPVLNEHYTCSALCRRKSPSWQSAHILRFRGWN